MHILATKEMPCRQGVVGTAVAGSTGGVATWRGSRSLGCSPSAYLA